MLKVEASWGVGGDDRIRNRRQHAAVTDGKSGDGCRYEVRHVDPLSIGSDGGPAICRAQSRNGKTDGGDGPVGKNGVGGDRPVEGCGYGSGGSGDKVPIGCEAGREEAHSGTFIDHDRAECAVGVDGEGVDIVWNALRDREKLTIGADGKR